MKRILLISVILAAMLLSACGAPAETPQDVSEFEDRIALLETQVVERESIITDLEIQMEGKESIITDLEIQVSELSERITQLEDNIKQLENQIVALSKATPEPTPLGKQWEIISINTKVTEKNDVWWKYAWILVIRNDSQNNLSFDATIEFLDAGGFIVDDDRAYDLRVNAGKQETFTGYALVDTSVAPTIKRTSVKVREG